MIKTKITKQVKQELKGILDNYGYWSQELKNYVHTFNMSSMDKLHILSKQYIKGEITL